MSATSAAPSVIDAPLQTASDQVSSMVWLRLVDYVRMSRPRIVVMSAASAAAGQLLAGHDASASGRWAPLLVGLSLMVAAASILNQWLEAATDRRMERTRNRPVAAGRVSGAEAAGCGAVLAVFGTIVLFSGTGAPAALASAATLLVYVFGYTSLKRVSVVCTAVGAIPGAMPPVIGWLAGDGGFSAGALALFAVFFIWQFPHFLAIGWIHRVDYERAGLRMLPSFADGGRLAGLEALAYATAFVPVSLMPRQAGLAGSGYEAAAIVLSLGYWWLTVRFCMDRTDRRARQLMGGSLLCLPVLLLCLVLDYCRLLS